MGDCSGDLLVPTNWTHLPRHIKNNHRLSSALIAGDGSLTFGVQNEKRPAQKGRPLLCRETGCTAYFLKKRRAIPSAPRAVPSNIIVAPPSGTGAALREGGSGRRVALAFWLKANIAAQKTTATSASFLTE